MMKGLKQKCQYHLVEIRLLRVGNCPDEEGIETYTPQGFAGPPESWVGSIALMKKGLKLIAECRAGICGVVGSIALMKKD